MGCRHRQVDYCKNHILSVIYNYYVLVFKFGIPVRQRQEGSTSIVVPKDVGDVEACGTLTATGDFGNRTIVVGTFTEDGTASGNYYSQLDFVVTKFFFGCC